MGLHEVTRLAFVPRRTIPQNQNLGGQANRPADDLENARWLPQSSQVKTRLIS